MGQIRGGLQGLGGQARNTGRDTGYLNNQIRALGTTLRYAIAGTTLYGIASTVQQLGEIQRQQGLIAAIGGNLGQQIVQSNEQIRQSSVNAITPVQDMNNAIINYLSTVNKPQGGPTAVLKTVQDIAQFSQLAQVSTEEATRAFTTMNIAFGRTPSRRNIQRMAQDFFILTRRAPGGVAAGREVIGQLGQLSAQYRAGAGTPAQMYADLLGVLRFGIPPAQAGRGLAFMAQTISMPSRQVKESRQALESIGITDAAVQRYGIQWAINKVMRAVRTRGTTGDWRKAAAIAPQMTDEELQAAAEGGGPGVGLGVSGAGIEFAGKVFHRIHALRSFIALYSRQRGMPGVKPGESLVDDLRAISESERGHVSETEDIRKAWKRFQDETALPQAARAVEAMRLNVISAFEPVLDPTARGITGLSRKMEKHPDVTKWATFGVAGALGASALLRMRGVRTLGFGGAVRGLSMAQAGVDLATEMQRGATPAKPLYVIVVAQMSGGGGVGPLGRGGPRGGPIITGGGRGARPSRWGRARLGFGVAGPILGGMLLADELGADELLREKLEKEPERRLEKRMRPEELDILAGRKKLELLPQTRRSGVLWPKGSAHPEVGRQEDVDRVLSGLRKGYISERTAEVRLQRIARGIGLGEGGKITGQATVEVKVKQPDGTTDRKKVKVPLTFTPTFQGGPRPTQRGGRKTNRGRRN
jgi:hypothetical protein